MFGLQNSREAFNLTKIYHNELNHTLTFLNVVQSAVLTVPITTQLILPVTTSMKLVILQPKKFHITLLSEKRATFK